MQKAFKTVPHLYIICVYNLALGKVHISVFYMPRFSSGSVIRKWILCGVQQDIYLKSEEIVKAEQVR